MTARSWTSTLPDETSLADWLACESAETRQAFLDSLAPNELAALPWLWDIWALPHQRAPEGDWKTWVILGGRGAGKTRAGAEWIRSQVEGATPLAPGRSRRVALVADTFDQARDVMVMGESGILACSPPDRRPAWLESKRRLVWPNGAEAQAMSASEPESFRGPQFDCVWADELAKWSKGGKAWPILQFALRLGDDPRQIVTTTPRNVPVLKRLLRAPTTVLTSASTLANSANLAPSFLADVQAHYGGTRFGRQELDGVLVEEHDDALWTKAMIDAARGRTMAACDRVVVAVDPAVTASGRSDACGIVVVGAATQGPVASWSALVIEDATVRNASPLGWMEAAVAAFHRHGADRMVAEVNQGGDLVRAMLDQVDGTVPFRAVHARAAKAARAEPVAALYEQGRVSHSATGNLAALEDQMCQMTRTGFMGEGSPDRLDALVWAVTDLILEPAKSRLNPGVRAL